MENKITAQERVQEVLKNLCSGLVYNFIYSKCQEILSSLPIAVSSQEKISNDSPTYRHRLRVAVNFLEKRNSKSQKIGSSEEEQRTFLEELQEYIADKLASCTDKELLKSWETSGNVSFLEEGCSIVVEGIVLRRSPGRAVILVHSSSSNAVTEVAKEIVVQVPNDIPGFGIRLKIGDVLSVRFSSATNREEHISLKRYHVQ